MITNKEITQFHKNKEYFNVLSVTSLKILLVQESFYE